MKNDNLQDLLADQAISGLTTAEVEEMRKLQEMSGHREDLSWELAAASLSLVDLDISEPLPSHIAAKVLADADKLFTEDHSAAPFKDATAPLPPPIAINGRERASLFNWLGWGLATAACFALAINVWFTRFQPADTANAPQKTAPTLTDIDRRAQLLAESDVVLAVWSEKDSQGVSGDVVWSDAKQTGYMRFRGLPANDITKETYQLWIFDETQDEKTPVDGGVFDVKEGGEVIIPINAKLKVSHPKAFAVTVEKPGGVVVSKREKIAAIGKVAT
jgi:hypothetical protein